MDGENILSSQTDLLELRRKIGMIFQKPSPFPMTVFDNVAYGLRQHYKMSQDGARRPRRARAQALGHLGRGQGQAGPARQRPERRPAAASVHRPGDRAGAGGHAHGRALLGHRPGGDGQDRGPGDRAQEPLHDRARHAQHAAGRACERLHGLLLPGAHRRVRPDDADLLEPGDRSRPRNTSPAGSAEAGDDDADICSERSTG